MSVEPDLVRVLGRWAVGSLVVGAALSADPRTRGFGRQTAAWGLVDGAIALVGARRLAAGRTTAPARLRRVLLDRHASRASSSASARQARSHMARSTLSSMPCQRDAGSPTPVTSTVAPG